MARVSTTTAKFNPFTMEELYAPVLRATEKHLEQQEKYDELANQAMIWQYRLNPETDPESYNLYNQFSNQMNAMVDDLNTNGILSPSARDNFSALRRSNPLPLLEENYRRMNELLDLRANNPDSVWLEGRPTMDRMLAGNVDNTHQSLTSIRESGALLGSNFAKGQIDEPAFKSILGGQFYQQMNRAGIPRNVLMALQNQNPEGLTAEEMPLYNDLYNASNKFLEDKIERFNDYSDADKARMKSAFWEGMTSGSETRTYNIVNNPGYENRGARIANDLNNLRLQDALAVRAALDAIDNGTLLTSAQQNLLKRNGIDPNTGLALQQPSSPTNPSSSRSNSGGGSRTNRRYIPNTVMMNNRGRTIYTGASTIQKYINEHPDEFRHISFKNLSMEQQRNILTNLGIDEETINSMYSSRPLTSEEINKLPQSMRGLVNSNPNLYNRIPTFMGTPELNPNTLSELLDIQVDNSGNIVLDTRKFSPSGDFTNDAWYSEMLDYWNSQLPLYGSDSTVFNLFGPEQ